MVIQTSTKIQKTTMVKHHSLLLADCVILKLLSICVRKQTLTKMQKSKEIASEVNVNEISEIFFCFWKSAIGKEIVKESPEDFLSFVSKGFDIIIGRLKEER